MPYFERHWLEGPGALAHVYATICSPHDPVRRNAHLEAICGKVMTEWIASDPFGTGVIDIRTAVLVARAPRGIDIIDAQRAGIDTREAHFAARALLFILRAAEHEPALASLNRVIIGEKAANRGLKSSERTLKEAWKKYSPVAHLWAAANSVASEEIRASGLEPAKLRMFLAYAEYLRRRGEAWTHPHGREPLLDPNETWKVPPDFALPKVSIKVGPLSAADVRLATGAK